MTRSSKRKLLTDPTETTQQLTEQLSQLGLYAANTLGDGNCLFRALSDQLYGTESHHLHLRMDICDWIEKHKARYEPFVEDERGIDVHLRLMRQPATYGGHLELSAFAHMARRDVKVIQPGLVYVIEWASGLDFTPATPEPSSSSTALDESLDDRPKRMTRREKKSAEKEKAFKHPLKVDETDDVNKSGPVYLAYHDWEHFSSIRNLRGPHQGIPNVREINTADVDDLPPPPNAKAKPKSKQKTKKLVSEAFSTDPPTPSQIPLPPSRSISPDPDLGFPSSRRSPKRTFESSGSSETSESAAKRSRPNEDVEMVNGDEEEDDTPALSEAFSTTSSTSSSPPPPPAPVGRPYMQCRKLRCQPKQHTPVVVGRSAGKIVIPGGRNRKSITIRREAGGNEKDAHVRKGGDEEWTRNGVGRVDVRGFRELRI
ncbi:hypothetical protein EW146_g9750 [Bondarzewia mesenterica]|uniref:OTU domain-containing protein n=1 Tax=Bondarzewia mesenterica TaxID=1095465 RepID=A0A4S4L532_9AGAM|nr:hypothetical protein EW146_g9750 [Bondarzewia mesenterica]